jgi:hypothetical protein
MPVGCLYQVVCRGGQCRLYPGLVEIGIDKAYFLFIPVRHQEITALPVTPDMIRSKNFLPVTSGKEG